MPTWKQVLLFLIIESASNFWQEYSRPIASACSLLWALEAGMQGVVPGAEVTHASSGICTQTSVTAACVLVCT